MARWTLVAGSLVCIGTTSVHPAMAQYTREVPARKKIDEAVGHHFKRDFDKAEGVLLGTIAACEGKCSPGLLARAWMFIGIVRGSGKNNQAGAKDAFTNAVMADSQISLDTSLATPATRKTFAGVTRTIPCGPLLKQVETRSELSIRCVALPGATAVEVLYQPSGGRWWRTLTATRAGDWFVANIPCDATRAPGKLTFYARTRDDKGQVRFLSGSDTAPRSVSVLDSDAEDALDLDEEGSYRCPLRSFDRVAASANVRAALPKVAGCRDTKGPHGAGRAELLFGAAGEVERVKLSTPFDGTSVGKCVEQVFSSVVVPSFDGESVWTGFNFRIDR